MKYKQSNSLGASAAFAIQGWTNLSPCWLNINKSQREKIFSKSRGQKPKAKLPVTYDDELAPDIENNFSLKDVDTTNTDHPKQSFDLNDINYTSVTQFIDKSVMYASYALKQENFIPDYIVAAPSSSEFNNMYCNNLANKMGIPFIKDFFKFA